MIDELRSLISRHAPTGAFEALSGVQLSIKEQPGSPTVSTTGTTFALIAQGAKQLTLGDRHFDYGAGHYLVTSVDLPVTGRFTEASPAAPALGFGLTLRASAIASVLLDEGGPFPRPGRGVAAASGLAVSHASPELMNAVVRMLHLLDQPRDLPVLAPMIEREIIWRLVTGDQGETVRQLGLADSSVSHVNRAVGWLRQHHAEPVRVEDLARLAGLSVSAFHRNFHAVTAMSPIQFQKRIRLQQARSLLLAGTGDVAGVGYAVGYDSPSQFSREYRRLFGTTPGRDRARLLGLSAA